MRYIVLLLCSITIAYGDLPGVTVDPGAPVEVVGSVVDLVTSIPSAFSWELETVETPLSFEPPSEYQALETVECRFVVPERAGIFPVVVNLSGETIEVNPGIELTEQAQQAVDISPGWLQEHLIWKLSILTEANQDRFGALLLAHQGQEYFDELAFTIAYLSWTILTNSTFDETLLVDNAQGIYAHDPFLSYVDVTKLADELYLTANA
jgi:hypothetical protein